MEKEKLRVLVVCKHPENSKEARECHLGSDEEISFFYSWKNTLKKNDLRNVDLVIAIGGDGTALSASHYLFDKPLLAVNSAPQTSEGALTTLNLSQLKEKLEEIKKGNHLVERLERLEIYVNGKVKESIALNEVFIANEKAYQMSRYELKLKRGGKIEKEKQYSSGIIFSTGTGSTAWFKSAGGEPFSPQSRFVKMLVREPFIRNLHRFEILNRVIHEDEEVEITPLTKMIVAIDSIREFKIKEDDKIKIRISRYPLLRIV